MYCTAIPYRREVSQKSYFLVQSVLEYTKNRKKNNKISMRLKRKIRETKKQLIQKTNNKNFPVIAAELKNKI